MTQDHATVTQPRRYKVRELYDVAGLTERQIADRLGVSQKTVNRDLASTVAPTGRTPGGAPVYPLGRFDNDLDYMRRVKELERDVPSQVAKRQAAREFAGGYRIGDVFKGRANVPADLSAERARIAAKLSSQAGGGKAA